MPDMEKVIKGMESCTGVDCTECQYGKEGHGHKDCVERLCADTLALVKEQEQAMKEKDGTISNLIAQIKEISQCYERVVRCKNCKYFDGEECNNVSSICKGIDTYADWFCHEGKPYCSRCGGDVKIGQDLYDKYMYEIQIEMEEYGDNHDY